MLVVPLEPPRRLSGDGGSALVEAALLTPLLFFFLIGLIEMGLFFRSYLGTNAAVTDAARTASVVGNDVHADYDILLAVRKATATMTTKDIVNLVVFDPSAPAAGATSATNPVDATAPAVCRNALSRLHDAIARCNAYTPGVSTTGDWYTVSNTQYACTSPNDFSAGYCPNTMRKTAKTGANGPPGFVGVTLTVKHKYISGMFGTTKDISSTVITALEPQSLQ